MTLRLGPGIDGFGFVKWGPLLEAGLTVAALPLGSLLGLFLLGTCGSTGKCAWGFDRDVFRTGCDFVGVSIYGGGVYLVRDDWGVRDVRGGSDR